MLKHKIAVISDTHSLLRPEIIEKIKECELTIHADPADLYDPSGNHCAGNIGQTGYMGQVGT